VNDRKVRTTDPGQKHLSVRFPQEMKVPPYLALGLIDWGDMRTVAVLAPFALAGTWIGYHATRLLPEKLFFRIVEVALFLISVSLIRAGLTGN
jgi:uncharacterized protein